MKALFAGSFAPPTLGHLNIIERASKLCKEFYVGIATNSAKNTVFSLQEKVEMLREITQHLSNVKVVMIDGLTATYAKEHKIDVLIRGLRPTGLEEELQLAAANQLLTGIETLFLPAEPSLMHISSTLIRELASHGVRLQDYVPEKIEKRVFETFR